jgi:hypothetical protein
MGHWAALLLRLAEGERVGVRGGCSRERNYLSSRRRPVFCSSFLRRQESSDFSLGRRAIAIWLACRGLPSSCRRRKASPLFGKAGSLFFACPKKSNQKKGPPDDAPSGPLALQVRGRVAGFFDRASCPGEKLAGIHAGHPAGYSSTRPPRHTGTPGARAGSRAGQRVTLRWRFLGRSAPCARPPDGAIHPCAAVAHKVRSYKVCAGPWVSGYLWERTLCATRHAAVYRSVGLSRTGCAPTDKPARQRGSPRPMRSEAPL